MTSSNRYRTRSWEEVADHLLNHFFLKDVEEEDTAAQREIRRKFQQPSEKNTSKEIAEEQINNLTEIRSEVGGLPSFVQVSKYLGNFIDGGIKFPSLLAPHFE